MHILIAVIYGVTLWLSGILYAGIAGTHRAFMLAFTLGPVIISAAVIFILSLDWALSKVAARIRKLARREA